MIPREPDPILRYGVACRDGGSGPPTGSGVDGRPSLAPGPVMVSRLDT